MLLVQNLNSNRHKFSLPESTKSATTMITEVNSNRKKHPSGASRLDTDAILVILETVLQTHTSLSTSQSHSSQVKSQRTTRCRSQTQQTLHSRSVLSTKDLTSSTTSPKRSQSTGDSSTLHCDRIPQTEMSINSTAKIEKAMDSAKMELLCTVRKEVSDLQSKVASLLQHQAKLEQENKFLREAAAPETLAKLGEYQRCPTKCSATSPATN